MTWGLGQLKPKGALHLAEWGSVDHEHRGLTITNTAEAED